VGKLRVSVARPQELRDGGELLRQQPPARYIGRIDHRPKDVIQAWSRLVLGADSRCAAQQVGKQLGPLRPDVTVKTRRFSDSLSTMLTLTFGRERREIVN
jgi:hypothetical protein